MRRLLIILGILLFPITACAQDPMDHMSHMVQSGNTTVQQDWARAKLEKSTRHGEWVKVKNGDRVVNCWVVYPEVKGKATAMLVIHEIFGMSDWVREMTDEIAAAGFVAIAPDLLSGMGPNGGGTESFDSGAVGRAISQLPPDQITGDLNAAADYISKVPAANGKLAVAGFCWGGGQTFRFATNRASLKAAFVFYGPPPDKSAMAKIMAPVYGFYAGTDGRIDQTIPDTIEAMKAAGKTYDPVTYEGAGHGFMRLAEDPNNKTEANKTARDQAWAKMIGIMKKL
ncbi:MAG TPA: dienelactone hydrolase family protein [Blastocatellia bacterium]|nr:dienelactone hydrolase family protein [Blastocatellia bacterium]